MIKLTGLVLDVLKPHQPSSLELASRIAETSPELVVNIIVVEMDDKTHTLQIEISGPDIKLEAVERVINELGGSVHSIDEVLVENSPVKEN
jgi:hypothetical protein